MESKKERFDRLAEARTNKILEMINLLGNLSNKNNYDYNDDDINKIFKAIEQEVKSTKSKFDDAKNKSGKSKFSLRD